MSTSVSPTGIGIGFPLIGSRVATSRTLSMTRRMLLPRTFGKLSVTVRLSPGRPLSLTGGTASVSTRLPSTTRPSVVGTEWRPSAANDRVMVEKLTGFGELTWIQASCWAPKPGLHIVAGSASKALALPSARAPGSRPEDSVLTPPDGRPVEAPSTRSLALAATRAVPVSAKVRAVGSVNVRATAGSVSDLNGSAGLARSRVI